MTESSPASALAGGSGIKALVGVAAILISLLYLRSVSHRGAPVPEVAKPSLAMSMAADREPTDEPPRPEAVRAAPRPLAKAAPEAKRSGPGAAFLLQRPATKEAPIGLTRWSAETLGPAPDEPRIAQLKPPSEPPAPALGSNVEPSTALAERTGCFPRHLGCDCDSDIRAAHCAAVAPGSSGPGATACTHPGRV